MKKIFIILLTSLVGISFLTVANAQTFSLWKLISNALLPVNSAWELGSSANRIVKGWFTNLDVSGSFTLGGTVASGGLNLNGEKLIFDADATTWMQSTDTQDYIFFVNNNATTTAISNLGYWGYGTTTPSLPLSVQASSSSGYFGISNTQDNDIFVIDQSGFVGIGTTSLDNLFNVYQSGSANIADFRNATGSALFVGENGNVGIGTTTPTFGLELMASSTDGYFGIGENGQKGNIFTIDEDGQVGIGNNNPTSLLDLGSISHGSAAMTIAKDTSGGIDDMLSLKSNGNAGTNRGIRMTFYTPGGSNNVLSGNITLADEDGSNPPKTYMAFGTNNGTALTERLRITSSGFVGIATTTPQSLLQVGTPLDDADSYMQMDVKTDTPPATDCDVDNEAGRFIFLSSSSDAFYICKGSGGWASTTLP